MSTLGSKPGKRGLRVWFVNHYAEPPDGMATRPIEIAEVLASHGYEVTILASNFGHYSKRYQRDLGMRLWMEERIGSVRLLWIQSVPYRGQGPDRVVNMAAFAGVAFVVGCLQWRKPDIVVGVTTHPLAALCGYFLARVKHARFFCEVTDLWPETLIQFGRISRNGFWARVLRSLERFLYSHSERVIMLWRDTATYVESLGVSSDKLVWIPHGVPESRATSQDDRYDGNIDFPFRLIFVGGFNKANSIGTIIGAARELRRRGRNDVIVELIGAGVEKHHWIRVVETEGLTNVVFPEPIRKSEVPAVLSQADALIYGLQDLPLYHLGITLNKLFDYLAAARPIIFFGNSSYDPVAEARAGIVVPPGRSEAIADAIEQLMRISPAERVKMGLRGRAFLREHHLIERLAPLYAAIFTSESTVPAERATK